MPTLRRPLDAQARLILAALAGAVVGVLGGMVGLGGAEFRLPLLIGLFGFAALQAVIVNKAISLVVVASALLFRAGVVPLQQVLDHWTIVATLLSGSLAGAWLGASWATRTPPESLHRLMALLLAGIAAMLMLHHALPGEGAAAARGPLQVLAGAIAGLGIGAVASLLGIAGGELLVPAIVLIFGADIKLAGSLSLAVSLPTMLVGFARYSRDDSFGVLQANGRFLCWMAAGSMLGAAAGAALLGAVSSELLLPLLAALLAVSAWKIWKHT